VRGINDIYKSYDSCASGFLELLCSRSKWEEHLIAAASTLIFLNFLLIVAD
jgi:hypothetical protein